MPVQHWLDGIYHQDRNNKVCFSTLQEEQAGHKRILIRSVWQEGRERRCARCQIAASSGLRTDVACDLASLREADRVGLIDVMPA